MSVKTIAVKDQVLGDGRFCVIGGPCVIEDALIAVEMAHLGREVCAELGLPYIYKSSYAKDNRTRHDTYRGPGLEKGLGILSRVREETGVPVLSDVHGLAEVNSAAETLDVLQLPAYLSKQTALTLALGETGKPINVKKGQFLTPDQVKIPIDKIKATGNCNILLTERGTAFGYGDLVFDPRSLLRIREFGYPVFFDVTHVVRIPGHTSDDPAGGLRGYIFPLARAAAALGCDGLFVEFHPRPEKGLCDAVSMLPADRLKALLTQCVEIHERVREWEKETQ
ncbi:MAG: 3-deoxy-8-phosphooctulonate synthase [Candidatus Coatesbacteria bacterium]|nr:MAG: 3-deoxy-8-phosphooctulonate synthase [Candidatus Coatesbacteria bacterium]